MGFFTNNKADSDNILRLPTEEQNEILRAFVMGSTIDTIAEVKNLTKDEVTTFLNNRVDEVAALKDFYDKMKGAE